MSNKLIKLAIVSLTLLPSIYLSIKGMDFFSNFIDQEVFTAYENFSEEVRAGNLDYEEIADRISKIATAEKNYRIVLL